MFSCCHARKIHSRMLRQAHTPRHGAPLLQPARNPCQNCRLYLHAAAVYSLLSGPRRFSIGGPGPLFHLVRLGSSGITTGGGRSGRMIAGDVNGRRRHEHGRAAHLILGPPSKSKDSVYVRIPVFHRPSVVIGRSIRIRDPVTWPSSQTDKCEI